MKLLSTIAFLLLTFSAFSQEKLSYQDGIIKQGEEVLSLYELSVLVNGANITYTKGLSTRHLKFDAEKTKRLRLAGDDKKVARALNAKAAAGTAVGAELAPRMLKQLQTLVKEKGSKHIMDKIVKKKGSAYLAGLLAKGALGSMFTVGTYGIGSVVTAGFLAKDVYDIYNILKEDLE